jgi:hypothetical protein
MAKDFRFEGTLGSVSLDHLKMKMNSACSANLPALPSQAKVRNLVRKNPADAGA